MARNKFTSEQAREAGMKSKRGLSKSSEKVKEIVENLTLKLYDSIITDWDQLDVKDKATLFARLVDYNLPKQRQSETVINIESLTDEEVNSAINRIIYEYEN